MITKEDAIDKFKEILSAKSSWKLLAKSQFMQHLAIFMSWCLRSALWAVERIYQEFFLSTALNDASVQAHAEDREYLPEKRSYSYGNVTITNGGSASISIPIDTTFVSDAGVEYVTAAAVIIATGESATIECRQLTKETITETVDEETSFYQKTVDIDTSKQINSYTVCVDTSGEGDEYEEWEYRRLFQNSYADEKIYDEFYDHKGQFGIRFGNAYMGTIPPVGSLIKIELCLTEGDTTLAAGQELFISGEILDYNGNAAVITAITATAITGGSEAETIEDMRSNLHYWPVYNEKLVWEDDYLFFIKRKIKDILWIKVWGEEEAEAAYGADVLFINKIFVSAYANRTGLEDEVIERFEELSIFNRKFEWVEPSLSTFDVSITGKVARTKTISDVQSDIADVLTTNYGKNSSTRKTDVLMKDIYDIINATEHFTDSGAYFEVTLSGTTVPTDLNEFVSIDESGITISLSYL